MFLDEAVIKLQSGSGGDGCVSFRREKFIPRGGPDGGNGGRGGSIYLEASRDLSTLLDIGRRRLYRAESGRPGRGKNASGRNGKDLIIRVPLGTVVREVTPGTEPRQGRLLFDLVEEGQRVRVARGGRGGRGNTHFATATHQVPRTAEKGEPGEEKLIYLELKLMADVGLIGLPNAGKSTLLSRLSAAHPKIADYPFTTLKPNLGIVELGNYERLVFADIPGLIEGAHLGHGLGIEFLRHIERTRVLVHLVSAEEPEPDGLEQDYRMVDAELASYSELLARKPRLVSLTKIDLLPPEERARRAGELAARLGMPVLPISAVTGEGIEALIAATAELLRSAAAAGQSAADTER
jgi:GTP-binding protein